MTHTLCVLITALAGAALAAPAGYSALGLIAGVTGDTFRSGLLCSSMATQFESKRSTAFVEGAVAVAAAVAAR